MKKLMVMGVFSGLASVLLSMLASACSATNNITQNNTEEKSTVAAASLGNAGVTLSTTLQPVVVVRGQFMKWSGRCAGLPPVSRSDWMLQNSNGCIYVSGNMPNVPMNTEITVQGKAKQGANKQFYIVLTNWTQ